MSVTMHAALVVAICAGVTLMLRAMPFVFFGGKDVPRLITALGNTLPAAIMAALVVYCLKGVPYGSLQDGLRQLAAAACVILLHLWKRNTLISIVGGTASYMLMVQLIF